MTVRFFIHSCSKRADSIALVDSGATENFMSLQYARYLQLPIRCLPEPCKLFNVDGTQNKAGVLEYYTDLNVQTGGNHTYLCFFLSDLGENKAILGYPWFAAVQPKIDWRRGWINYSQLPIVFRAADAAKAQFTPRTVNRPRTQEEPRYFLGRVMVGEMKDDVSLKIPPQYRYYTRVFSKEASHKFPPTWIWDHAIELKLGAPTTLPGKIYPLLQMELKELEKFVQEHLKRGTIRPSKSPYAASFFFIKKKDGKL